jgi:hypothetical protein
MTDLTNFIVINDVTDNLATYNNRYRGSMFSADNTNTLTISATKELTDNDCIFQVVTTDGSAIELPPEATTNHPHLIYNTSPANTLPVKDDSGATTFITLAADEWAYFLPVSGEAWEMVANNQPAAFTASSTTTLTNKRITPRLTSETSSATPTINTDNTDIHTITALAAAITSFTTNLSGTPTEGQELIIQITDNATARAITWGASFASTTVTLPTTTVISTRLRVQLMWNAVTSKWDCVGKA